MIKTDDLAPVVLFAYKRVDLLRPTVEALARNDLAAQSRLIVYSDGPKRPEDQAAVAAVRAYLRGVDGFADVEIVEQTDNIGLAASVISGVDAVVQRFGRAIVVEDDLISSRHFLTYMNEVLVRYADERQIFTATGYNYPPHRLSFPAGYRHDVFLGYRAHSWSWVTWADRWRTIDWQVPDFCEFLASDAAVAAFNRGGRDLVEMLACQMVGLLDSWAIRFCYAQHKYGGYCVYPRRSLIRNVGFNEDATHCFCPSDPYDVDLDDTWRVTVPATPPAVDESLAVAFADLFDTLDVEPWRKLLLSVPAEVSPLVRQSGKRPVSFKVPMGVAV